MCPTGKMSGAACTFCFYSYIMGVQAGQEGRGVNVGCGPDRKEDARMADEDRRKLNRRDILLAACIVAAALVFYLVFHFTGRETGSRIVIRVDGAVQGTYSLSEAQTIPVETKYGKNVVEIRGGQAFMKEADCPDHYCMQQGKIDQENETIVCLPHKLVVEVISGEEEEKSSSSDGVDAVAQ